MKRAQVGEIHIVPEWFGLEPSEAQEVIARLLERAGGRPSGEVGTSYTLNFTLNARAVDCLRRDGFTVRNHRAVRSSYRSTVSTRAQVAAVRSWVAMTKASVSAYRAHAARRRPPFELAPVIHPRATTIEAAAATPV